MSTASMQLADPSGLLSLGLFGIGVALLALLAGAFWLGNRVRSQEPPRPTPEEQPHVPESGPVREIRENREPEEIPEIPKGERPLTPYELTNMQTRSSTKKDRPRWSKGSSGSFGGGGLGAH